MERQKEERREGWRAVWVSPLTPFIFSSLNSAGQILSSTPRNLINTHDFQIPLHFQEETSEPSAEKCYVYMLRGISSHITTQHPTTAHARAIPSTWKHFLLCKHDFSTTSVDKDCDRCQKSSLHTLRIMGKWFAPGSSVCSCSFSERAGGRRKPDGCD